VTSAQSVGAHRLIQDGAALIQGWEDVVSQLPLRWRDQVKSAPAIADTAMTTAGMTATAMNDTMANREALGPNHLAHGQHAHRHVEDESHSLLRLIGEEPADIDGIIERSGLTPGRASALLVTLEVEGRIRQLEGKRFVQVSLG
jgi:DNA processing protein